MGQNDLEINEVDLIDMEISDMYQIYKEINEMG